MLLQADPTTAYGLGEGFDGNLRRKHLDDEGNPYELSRIHGDENRIWVDYEQMPSYLTDVTIATEDKRFLEHQQASRPAARPYLLAGPRLPQSGR